MFKNMGERADPCRNTSGRPRGFLAISRQLVGQDWPRKDMCVYLRGGGGAAPSSALLQELNKKGKAKCLKSLRKEKVGPLAQGQLSPTPPPSPTPSYLFLFSSSAISCLCCLLASKLKPRSADGHGWRESNIRGWGKKVFTIHNNGKRDPYASLHLQPLKAAAGSPRRRLIRGSLWEGVNWESPLGGHSGPSPLAPERDDQPCTPQFLPRAASLGHACQYTLGPR